MKRSFDATRSASEATGSVTVAPALRPHIADEILRGVPFERALRPGPDALRQAVASSLPSHARRLALSNASTLIQAFDANDVEASVPHLLAAFALEAERDLQILLIRALRLLAAQAPHASLFPWAARLLVEAALSLEALEELLLALPAFLRAQPPALLSSLPFELHGLPVLRYVRHPDPRLRLAAVPALAALSALLRLHVAFFPILAETAHDPDSRVRIAALDSLRLQFEQLGEADFSTVLVAVVAAMDDDLGPVRLAALRAFHQLSSLFKDQRLLLNATSPIALGDYAFLKISDAVNDTFMPVRAEACALLGKLSLTSPRYFMQTLSKKVVSVDELTRGEPNALKEGGVVLHDPNLAVGAAAGAFVHGLEDEFYQVRSAAIESMQAIAQISQDFALEAVPFLVDTFNDEITGVRVLAINALRSMHNVVQLDDEQLLIVMATLEDRDETSRLATYRLLSSIRLSSARALARTAHALLQVTLAKYPEDFTAIARCLAAMGRSHGLFAELVAPELLRLSDLFAVRQESVENLPYLGLVVLFLSASHVNPTLTKLLPSHFERYRQFLALRYPDLLKPTEEDPMETSSSAHSRLDVLISSLSSSRLTDSSLTRFLSSLDAVARLDPSSASSCAWVGSLLQLLQGILVSSSSSSSASIASGLSASLRLLHSLRSAFVNIAPEWLPLLSLARLWLLSRSLVLAEDDGADSSVAHLLPEWRQRLVTLLETLRPSLPPALLRLADSLDDPSAPQQLVALLLEALQTLPRPSQLKATLEFSSSSAPFVELLPYFPLAVPVKGQVLPALADDLFLAVEYPDRSTQFIPLDAQCREHEGHGAFSTSALLVQGAWSESAAVSLKVVRKVSPEEDGLDELLLPRSEAPVEGKDYVPLSPALGFDVTVKESLR